MLPLLHNYCFYSTLNLLAIGLVLCNHYYIIIVFYSTLNLLAIGLVLCYHYYIIIVFIVH